MAKTNYGFPGTITSAVLAKWIPRVGASRYGVLNASDWQVAPYNGVARSVLIRAGSGWGDGVLTETDTDYYVQLPAITDSSAYKWFLIVARRTWGSTNTTDFAAIPGGVDPVLPVFATNVGAQADQPLALVKLLKDATGVLASDIIDLRVWPGEGGGSLYAKSDLVRSFMNKPGTRLDIAGMDWAAEIDASGNLSWTVQQRGIGAVPWGASFSSFSVPANSGKLSSFNLCTANLGDPGFKYVMQAHATVEVTDPGSSTRWDIQLVLGGSIVDISRGDVSAPWMQVSGNSPYTYTGPTTAKLVAVRQYGTGNFGLTNYNRMFHGLLLPAK